MEMGGILMEPQFSLLTGVFGGNIMHRKMSARDTMRIAADCGVRYVDINQVKLKQAEQYRKDMEDTNVRVYCYVTFAPFFDSEEKIRAKLREDMAAARALGAQQFLITPYTPFRDDKKVIRAGAEGCFEKEANGYRIAVELAKEYGLQVCFEAVPRAIVHLASAQECRRVLEAVPGLGFVLDTANALVVDEKAEDVYAALKDRMTYVHLKDIVLKEAKKSFLPDERVPDGRLIQMVAFGTGMIPVKELYDRILADGYTGVFGIEYARPDFNPHSVVENRIQLGRYLEGLR